MKVRQVRENDWPVLRRLRLEALAEAPDAFASSVEQELALPEGVWIARARSNAEGTATSGFIAEAEADGGGCGIVVGVWSGGEHPTVTLNALWVAPAMRRRGGAQLLVEAVERWARARGATRVELEVTETSRAATALYERLGYEVISAPAPTCGERRAVASKLQKRLR